MGPERGASVELRGTPASPGLAAGPLVRLRPPAERRRIAGDPAAERDSLQRAIEAAAGELGAMMEAAGADEDAAGILAFQLAFLEDATLTDPVYAAIAGGTAAEQAWREALDAQVADFAGAEDEYFRGRASDLVDLRERVLDRLAGRVEEPIPAGAIVVADDLPPSRFLAAEWQGGGLVLLRGSATSHVALLARSRGVPVLVGVGAADLEGVGEALLDAEGGLLVLNPDATARRRFEARCAAAAARRAEEAAYLHRPAVTAAGERVQVMINIAGPDELAALDPTPYDGIGLVRTEFLFHGRGGLPSEEEQYRAYRRILEWAGLRPVTIRTLDAGGDKPVPGLTRAGESNPFLGVRGVRLTLRRPDVFRVQLRALARAARHGRLKVMVPMVTLPHELAESRALLQEVVDGLVAEGVAAALPPLGMMVEVPAAALMLADFPADFFSIGSNDLIQYLTAASRDEPELAALAQPSPALWRLLGEVAAEGRRSGREVGLCGDLAGDAGLVPQLLECGLRSLSMPAPAAAAVKAAIARHGRPA
jgi:phosphotransferase system enzyme I (PtsI)